MFENSFDVDRALFGLLLTEITVVVDDEADADDLIAPAGLSC